MVAVCLAGCSWDDPPVAWEAPTPLASSVDTLARYGARWTPGASPEVVVAVAGRADSTGAVPAPEAVVAAAGVCPG